MLNPVLPAFHLRVTAQLPIDAGAILDAALVPQRKRHPHLAGGAEPAFVEKESQGVDGSMPYFTPRL